MTSSCPDDRTLHLLIGSELDEASLISLAPHVDGCPACQRRVEQLLCAPETTRWQQLLENAPQASRSAPVIAVPGYEILEELGRGGMGVVYKARQIALDRLVALKILLAGAHAGPEDRLRFQREAMALARLQHPNIVQVYEVGEQQGLPYLALEYVPGGTLAKRLARTPQDAQAAAQLVQVLAQAVHSAHQRGIIHRDLKPGNILMSGEWGVTSGEWGVASGEKKGGPWEKENRLGSTEQSREMATASNSPLTTIHSPLFTPKITDFGLAKAPANASGPTKTGQVMGTPSYMAPEQMQEHAVVGPAADVYALGSILYETVTGRPPFQAPSPLAILEQVLHNEPLTPSRLVPQIPVDLETIILKCLQKEPSKRYVSAAALADDLQRFLHREPIEARPVGRIERAGKWIRRRPTVAGLSAAVVLLSVLGVAGITWQWRSAVAAGKDTRRERDHAQAERDAARWLLYRSSISAAASALQLHNALACQRQLDAAPLEHRNWEWRHFDSLLQNGQAVLSGHKEPVQGVRFSADGTRLVSWSEDHTLKLWDFASRREIATLVGHSNEVDFVVWAPDGSRLASVSKESLRIWNGRTGAAIAAIQGLKRFISLAVSPDGARLLSGDQDNPESRVWDFASGRQLAVLKHDVPPFRVACSPDGRWIAGAGGEMVQIWNAHTYQPVRTLRSPGGKVYTMDFSPDGSRLATGCDYPDSKVRIFDVAAGTLLSTEAGHQNRVSSVQFSPDGSRLVSASMDQTVRLWDTAAGQPIAILRGHNSSVNQALFNPDGSRILSSAGDGTLRLWDAKTGDLIAVLLGHTGGVNGAAYSPDGSHIASASADKNVILWDAGQVERSGVLRGHTSYVYDTAISHDGTQIASAAWDNSVRLWDGLTGQAGRVLTTEDKMMLSVAFSPDGRTLAAGSRNSRLWLWDLATGKVRLRLQLPGKGSESLSFSPDGTRLAVALGNSYGGLPTGDHTIRLLDAASGAETAVLRGHKDNVLSVRFSPDGQRLASAGFDNSVRLWNASTAAPLAELTGHTNWVHAVAWNAVGNRLASGGEDRSVRIWDADTFQEIAVLAHASIVYALAFSPDGTRLAVGCQDNTIRLWDMRTYEEVAELRGHTAYVHALAFSPDGTRLISASGDNTVRIWDSKTLQEKARANR